MDTEENGYYAQIKKLFNQWEMYRIEKELKEKKQGDLNTQGIKEVAVTHYGKPAIWQHYSAHAKNHSSYGECIPPPSHIDNLIETHKNIKKAITKEDTDMSSPKFSDGSFTKNIRKSGLMRYRFMLDGNRVTIYGYSEHECWKQRADIIAGKDTKKPTKAKKQYTVAEWLIFHYKTFGKQKVKKTTQQRNENFINEIAKKFGNTLLTKATTDQIQTIINSFEETGNKQMVVTQRIRSSFRKAANIGLLKSNPCEFLEIETHTFAPTPLLQLAEQRKILDNITIEKYKDFFMFLCCTGVRLGEARNALENMDFKNRIIEVTLEDSKTKKHRRIIPFLPEVLTPKMQQSLLELNHKTARNYLSDKYKELGISAKIHSTRVTFISLCGFLKIDLAHIQMWAAHSDPNITLKTYTKLLRPDGTSAILEYLKALKNETEL